MSKLFVQVERVEDLMGRVDDYFAQPKQKPKPITNADRIRAMTDEELAKWMAINTDCFFCKVKNENICSLDEGTCTEEWLWWLKNPAEEEAREC